MARKIMQSEFTRAVAKRSEGQYHLFEIQDVLELLLGEIEEQVTKGNSIRLNDFGVFKPIWHAPKTYINPQGGDRRSVGSFLALKFNSSDKLRARVKKATEGIKEPKQKKEVKDED